MAGVRRGTNTVIPYGKWRPVALRWSVSKSYITLFDVIVRYVTNEAAILFIRRAS